MSDQRCSDSDQSKRDIPSFIEPRPPLILNPFMRPRPQKGTNLLELFDEDSESEEPEWLQVYLRLKPCNVRNNLYEVKSDRCLITSVDTAPMGHGRRTQHNVSKMYTFSHIFGTGCSQKEIFEHVVKGNLKKLPEGHNFTLLTYGASGSGKTYTLMGTVQAPGLVPRSLEYVFRVVDAAQQPIYKPFDGGAEKLEYYSQEFELQFVKRLRQVSAPLRDKYRRMSVQLRNDLTTSTIDLTNRTRYYVWVSFVEIYNESIYDLLSNSDRSKATSKLRIREDSSGNVYVKGATQAFVRTGEEAYDVMVAGKHNLQVAATGVHANSSRSHCIFTITMLTETEDGVRSSCVRLCDLAGCERARHTRNTGARMQESRSINSSLHVLERCLHMLRRKQKKVDATLVPYRESKLTRLLGAGLSGARGEAVSMVVTLNPAPEYCHETRHVLQLAAVAKDIQVNQTIAESTLESTATLNSTMETSAEIMKLRSDNERLHFELIQAQTRNKELLEAMEEKQQEVAKTMFEIVEEAKDMTRQYYETQLQSLRAEMDEMQEEYEIKLKTAADARESADVDTPSRSLQKKITELMTVIAVLEEKLTAEKLARARAEEEVQHLRACIDERDEKADEETERNHEEVMSVTDSESEEEEDLYNESLEPTFKKEDINRSRMLQQSLVNDSKNDITVNDDVNNDNDVESVKNDTLKDVSQDDTVQDATYCSEESNSTDTLGARDSANASELNTSTDVVKRQSNGDIQAKVNATVVRGTYFVRDDNNERKSRKSVSDEISEALTSMNRIRQSIEDMEEDFENNLEKSLERTINNMSEKDTGNIVNRIFSKSMKSTHESDVSLAQFEQLEIASKKSYSKPKVSNEYSNIKILKENRKYFDDSEKDNGLIPKLNKDKTYFDNIDANLNTNKKLNEIKHLDDDRSPSIVKENVTNSFEPSTIKKLLGESFARQAEIKSSAPIPTTLPKKHVSVDIFESPQVITEYKSNEITASVKKTAESILKTNDKHVISSVKKDITTIAEDMTQNKTNEEKDISHNSKDKLDLSNKQESQKPNENISIFEKCIEKVSICPKENNDMIEHTRQSIENIILKDKSGRKQTIDIKIKQERVSVEPDKNDASVYNTEEIKPESQNNSNNTVEDFENIYKDITAPRATEFELLVSSNASHYNLTTGQEKEIEKPKYNLRSDEKKKTVVKKEPTVDTRDKSIDNKVNGLNENDNSINKIDTVDKKDKSINKKDTNLDKREECLDKKANMSDEILLESQARCESKMKPKRNLRLRRRKNPGEDDQGETQAKTSQENTKLKDIANLQKEFSDVTMDLPAPVNKAKADIESPEKNGEENLPPLLGIQSCPSKSVTRSRRKLFTPRAEPLEESMAQSGDSNERIRVPRPSYHRTRARRKL